MRENDDNNNPATTRKFISAKEENGVVAVDNKNEGNQQ